MAEREKVTPKKVSEWTPVFLSALADTANVRLACKTAGIARKTAYQHRKESPTFAAQWDEALEQACDVLEAEARRRALTVSDTLMIFLLKAHRPEKYRETRQDTVLDLDVTALTDEQLDRIASGENPLHVMAATRGRRTGTPAATNIPDTPAGV